MLYQEARPEKFEDFIGNERVIKVLHKYIEINKMPHCFMFTGSTGVGKTTLAMILAKYLEVDKSDLYMINASLNRGIDTIRKLEETGIVSSYPMFGKSKMIVFDEAHKLTSEAQNGLLQLTENISDFLYYVFCTTEPKSLIATLRGRADKFKLDPLSTTQMEKLILDTCKRVNIPVPESEVIREIVVNSEGSNREAVMLLERQIGLIPEEAIAAIRLDTEDEAEIVELCRKLVNSKYSWLDTKATFEKIRTAEVESIHKVILSYLSKCVLGAKNRDELLKMNMRLKVFLRPTFVMTRATLLAMVVDCKLL